MRPLLNAYLTERLDAWHMVRLWEVEGCGTDYDIAESGQKIVMVTEQDVITESGDSGMRSLKNVLQLQRIFIFRHV